MKKARLVFAAISALIILTSSRPMRVACIGDSITYGAAIDDREHDSYPAVLQRMLGDGYEVRNFGVSGRVMLKSGDCPYWKDREYADAKAFLPDVVTIMLGTNDSKPWNWARSDEFKGDYLAMIDELRNLPTHPHIYLCLPPKPTEIRWGINDSTIFAGVLPVVRSLADRRWLDLVDTYSTLDGKPEMYADGIHPNEAGARLLAEEIYKVMERAGDTGPQGLRVVLIGDSITDGAWGKADSRPTAERQHYDMNHIYGHSYPAMVAAHFLSKYPERRYRFYNRGIGGDRLTGLAKRWDDDVLALRPDVVSILIGINDTGGTTSETFDYEGWEKLYRETLDRTVAVNPDVKFVLGTPFVEKVGATGRRDNFDDKLATVRRLDEIVTRIAKDYDAVLLPYHELMADLIANDRSGNDKYWIWDGIHPTYAAHSRFAALWIKKTKKIMK